MKTTTKNKPTNNSSVESKDESGNCNQNTTLNNEKDINILKENLGTSLESKDTQMEKNVQESVSNETINTINKITNNSITDKNVTSNPLHPVD